MFLYLALFFCVSALAWDTGFYQNRSDCLQWHSSCKECTTNNACSEWEEFMFLNTTSQLWELWNVGDYFDGSTRNCNSWGSSWFLYWNYQTTWFDCPPGEIYDLDTQQWISNWDSPKVTITDSDLSLISSYCRNLNYYIDPTSEESIELGTKEYPYRTIAPVFAEVLKHVSHHDYSIYVWIKEETTVFIEDSKIHIINMTKVNFSTYSESDDPPKYATLMATDSSVENLSAKAAFHVIKNMTLDVASVISAGNFSDTELEVLGREGETFHVSRTSISFSNFYWRRQASNSTSGRFIFLSYLQDKSLALSNS